MNVNFIFCKKENKKKINYCSILSLVLEATQHRSIYLRLINCLNSDNQKEFFWVNKQKKKRRKFQLLEVIRLCYMPTEKYSILGKLLVLL